jgi:hypothetical protein
MKTFLLCCFPIQPESSLISDVESISNIILALLTLILAYYVFVYQRHKDNENKIETEELHKKNIKLQWFKEIIIQPRIQYVFGFYESLNNLRSEFSIEEIGEDKKIEIINKIKQEQSKLRKSFLDLIQHVNLELHNEIAKNIDSLTDQLTDSVSNDELKLNNNKTYEREINTKIKSSYNDVLSKIFNFCG